MTEVDVGGYRLECLEDGSGEPLVLVHGSASDYRTWQRQRSAFSEHFRVIAYSRRYHWPNEPIPESGEYSMTEQVDDLQALLRTLDAAPAHLVGHSYGGFLCLLLAVREPALVRSLVLTEPPVVTLFVSPQPKPLELLRVLVSRPRTGLAILKFGARGVAPASRAFREGRMQEGVEIVGDAVFGAGGYRRLGESRQEQVQDNLANVAAEVLGPGFAPLEPATVRGVDLPTLLISGERSIALFQRLTDRLEELLPRCERIEVPGAWHLVHEDNAPAYNAAVLAFLAKGGNR